MPKPECGVAGTSRQGRNGKGRLILLAEDEALIALSIADLLEAEGFDVVLAPNGLAALERAAELGTAFDVLLTDLNMPEMGGEDLIRVLRRQRPELPVIVVTGAPPQGGLEELIENAGGNGPLLLLTKPVDYDQLVATLRSALSQRDRARHLCHT